MPRHPGPSTRLMSGSPPLSGGIRKSPGSTLHHLSTIRARHTGSDSSFTSVSSFPPRGTSPCDRGTEDDDDEEAAAHRTSPGLDEIVSGIDTSAIDPLRCSGCGLSSAKSTTRIYRSHRRSSSLSECMMRERLSIKALGRDRNGIPCFSLRMEESQGLKWNRNLHRISTSFSDTPWRQSFGAYVGAIGVSSDEEAEENSDYENVFEDDSSQEEE